MIPIGSTIYRRILAGALLPVFLFNLLLFAPQAAAGGEEMIRVEFRSDPGLLGGLQKIYSMQNLGRIFSESPDISLAGYFKAEVSRENLALMAADQRFGFVAEEQTMTASTVVPDDTYFTLDPMSDTKQWYLSKIKMPDAWEFGTGSDQTTVAIVDTGIHSSHVELNDGRVVKGYNSVSKSLIPANSDSDDNGHGTAVAGIIGAISDNQKGIAGINWKVKLMPIKALGDDGTGFVSDVAAGIVWAVDNGASVINLSMGGQGFASDETLNQAIAYAFNNNVLVVAAAGNDLAENGMNLDASPVYPICDDQGKNMVLGVAATDLSDQKAPFSNFGNACVDISAPGKMILTTGYLPSDPSDNVLIYGSGTSLAAPLVSGVAALMKSNRPELSNTQIRDIILRTADNIDSLNLNNCLSKTCSGLLGRGRLNAMAALSPQPLLDGSFVRQTSTNKIFRIVSGSKQYVSPFVFQQRGFDQKEVMPEYLEQLNTVAEIPALPPIEGTLIKSVSDPTVYVINDQLKRPLTYTVFVTRNFRFSDVKTMPEADVAALKAGDWYWPPDGTLVLVKGDPTVFVMNKGSRRAVTYFVFTQRKLSFARVMQVTPDEFSHIPKAPDAYWLPPLEGTLVKSASTETVYLIQNESRKPLSAEAFVNRKFKFSSIKSLPQAEIEVIMPGSPIFN